MGRLVTLDDRNLLDGNVSGRETGTGEVGRLEFAQSLFVKLRLKILENESKFCHTKKEKIASIPPQSYESKVQQKKLTQDFKGGRVSTTFERRSRHDERCKKNSSQAKCCGEVHFCTVLGNECLPELLDQPAGCVCEE
jgi:hypothetical protein